MYRIVLTTVASREDAERIAHALVDARLAACVNIVPQIHSVYRWQGKVEASDELLLVVKTTADRFAVVKERILELHPYELPECIAIDVHDGSEPYLRWIGESTKES
jgi:periplasmic divalent cation tolerance protein